MSRRRGAPIRSCLLAALVASTTAGATDARAPLPIPPQGSLANPRQPHQVGEPVAATARATPPDNPQTSEKIALGLKLFFDGRLSVNENRGLRELP